METKKLTEDIINNFLSFLKSEEKSAATVEKYLRDIRAFREYTNNREITKELVIEYKKHLVSQGYAVRSINSMIASINSLFVFLGWEMFRIKSIKLQREIFCSEEKELTKSEYLKLVDAAHKSGNERLSMILQTICATGIRISELKFITVEGVKSGKIIVECKAKCRIIFIVRSLRKKLLKFASKNNILSGSIFITKNGNPINRTNVWKEMKKICLQAGVEASKVFPHNLRHLFAKIFYEMEKDIVKLADILGHSSINTTRIYTISTGREYFVKLEKLNLII